MNHSQSRVKNRKDSKVMLRPLEISWGAHEESVPCNTDSITQDTVSVVVHIWKYECPSQNREDRDDVELRV